MTIFWKCIFSGDRLGALVYGGIQNHANSSSNNSSRQPNIFPISHSPIRGNLSAYTTVSASSSSVAIPDRPSSGIQQSTSVTNHSYRDGSSVRERQSVNSVQLLHYRSLPVDDMRGHSIARPQRAVVSSDSTPAGYRPPRALMSSQADNCAQSLTQSVSYRDISTQADNSVQSQTQTISYRDVSISTGREHSSLRPSTTVIPVNSTGSNEISSTAIPDGGDNRGQNQIQSVSNNSHGDGDILEISQHLYQMLQHHHSQADSSIGNPSTVALVSQYSINPPVAGNSSASPFTQIRNPRQATTQSQLNMTPNWNHDNGTNPICQPPSYHRIARDSGSDHGYARDSVRHYSDNQSNRTECRETDNFNMLNLMNGDDEHKPPSYESLFSDMSTNILYCTHL